MKKTSHLMIVSLIGLLVWLPVWMLIGGSFMAVDEIKANFGPVLLGTKGLAKWPLLPKYLTLRPYVELLLDSPEFFAMFWNSVKLVIPVLIGQIVISTPAAWAFARLNLKERSSCLPYILH